MKSLDARPLPHQLDESDRAALTHPTPIPNRTTQTPDRAHTRNPSDATRTDLGTEEDRGEGEGGGANTVRAYLLVGDLGLVGEDEVDGELGGDGRQRGGAGLHERHGRGGGLDVGGHLLPRLREGGVGGRLGRHLRRREHPAAAAGGGGGGGAGGGQAAGGVAQHFSLSSFSLSRFSSRRCGCAWVGGMGFQGCGRFGGRGEVRSVGQWEWRRVWAGPFLYLG